MGMNLFAGLLASIMMMGGVMTTPVNLVFNDNSVALLSTAAASTKGQDNAVKQAKSYLKTMPFSRLGLIDQLSSPYGSGFLEEEAVYAVDYLERNKLVDWNEQAVKCAKNYLKTMAFSRAGLIDQMSSDFGSRFTKEQAEFAISTLESQKLVDWNEQAVKSAQDYLQFMDFSRQGLIDQLSSQYGSKFTKEQAEYAATAVGF